MFSATNGVSGTNHYKCKSYQAAVDQFRDAEADGIVEQR